MTIYDLTIKYKNGETVTVEANIVNIEVLFQAIKDSEDSFIWIGSELISVNEIDYFSLECKGGIEMLPSIVIGLFWSVCAVVEMIALVIAMYVLATLLKEFTKDED